jgi:hypothetical protein
MIAHCSADSLILLLIVKAQSSAAEAELAITEAKLINAVIVPSNAEA